jgi:hypothetical protein
MMQLYIGNKNYSSWSMRPWVLLTQAGIEFEEVMVRFDAFTPDSQFKTTIGKLNPVAKVPVLVDGTWWSGTRWPLPNIWPNSSPKSTSGLWTRPTVPAPKPVRRNAQRLWRPAQRLPDEH